MGKKYKENRCRRCFARLKVVENVAVKYRKIFLADQLGPQLNQTTFWSITP
ncbi:hypothetical protein M5D96_009149 [Drosophila gunungcola]|uniref:Uncharacterized protein n=1 Tax=Drosophila gunungcola TaxID=103775 RepID=A0A9P9YK70_9MUSC|nr:hypothetical protein M5D96_009149 [Drosophila gunungcola]